MPVLIDGSSNLRSLNKDTVHWSMVINETESQDARQLFMRLFRGSLTSALRWHHLDALWERLDERAGEGWYIYAIGEPPPQHPVDAETFRGFLREIDKLLREEHDEDYCGIVYADDLSVPSFVKIYDPKNLGVSCGSSDNPPLPGWLLTLVPPFDLQSSKDLPKSRKHWWQRLFAG